MNDESVPIIKSEMLEERENCFEQCTIRSVLDLQYYIDFFYII